MRKTLKVLFKSHASENRFRNQLQSPIAWANLNGISPARLRHIFATVPSRITFRYNHHSYSLSKDCYFLQKRTKCWASQRFIFRKISRRTTPMAAVAPCHRVWKKPVSWTWRCGFHGSSGWRCSGRASTCPVADVEASCNWRQPLFLVVGKLHTRVCLSKPLKSAG